MKPSMTIQNFIVALIALLASLQGQTFDQVSTAVMGALAKKSGADVENVEIFEAGNAYSSVFDNTSISSIPASWGDTSTVVQVGATNGGAFRGRTNLQSVTGVTSRIEWFLVTSAMTEGTYISLNVGKGISPLLFYDGSTPIAWYLRLANIAGQHKVQIAYPTSGGEVVSTWSGVVGAGEVFQTIVEYDLISNYLLLQVNGETVVKHSLDSAAIRSIGTLVIGSSGGSTGRNITILADRIVEHVLPHRGVPPTGVSVASPATGATGVEVSAAISCAGTNANAWELQLETVNPPVGAYISLGTSPVYNPPTPLLNNTTYYARCRASNSNGVSDPSAVSSFTTITPTSTGLHPKLLITAGRQTTWGLNRSKYLADTTCTTYAVDSNDSVGCYLYKGVIDQSNAGNSGIGSAYNFGLSDMLLANIAGNDASFHCGRAYSRSTDAQNLGLLKYPTVPIIYADDHREWMVDWVLIYDGCYQSWTQTQRDTYLARLNALATHILNVKYPNGWRCIDVDQPIGDFFGIAALYYATESYNPTIVSLWADDDLGGVTPGTPKCSPTTDPAVNARNIIKKYITASVGGAWVEGTVEYAGSGFLAIWGCEAIRTVAAAADACLEVDTWTDDYARFLVQSLTPDLGDVAPVGDDEEPHEQWLGRFNVHENYRWTTLSGLLPSGTEREQFWRQFLNFRVTNGVGRVHPSTFAARAMMLANPYITAAADLSALSPCYQAAGFGIHIFNTGRTASDSQYWSHFLADPPGLDHANDVFGNIQLRRRNRWAVTHPVGYAGLNLIPNGSNSVAIEGLSPPPTNFYFAGGGLQHKRVTGYTCGSDYQIVTGTTGGLRHTQLNTDGQLNYWDPPPRYVHEYTRTAVALPTATKTYDSWFVVDRINAVDPESLEKFTRYRNPTPDPTCWPATCPTDLSSAEQARIQASPRWSSFLHQWVDTEPTVAANVTSWTLSDGQPVRDVWVAPDAVTITKENTLLLAEFGVTLASGLTDPKFDDSERKWRTKIEPNSNVQWNCLLRVITARDAGAPVETVNELTPTNGAAGVHLVRTGNNDVIAGVNCNQGPSITQLYPTQAQATAVLATARYFAAGSYSYTWTQTTATGKFLAVDLNPALTWTFVLDGGASTPITEDASGVEELSISGTGPHTLVITGI